jgi:hypothetical protein
MIVAVLSIIGLTVVVTGFVASLIMIFDELRM